jgi:hypothetical protein
VQVRYRVLSSKFDPQAFGIAFEDGLTRDLPRVDVTGSAVDAVIGAPKQVSADEASAELEEVCRMVETGRLKLRDLVNTGDGWLTVQDCPLLDDACERFRGARSRRWLAIAAVAAALIVVGVVYVLMS